VQLTPPSDHDHEPHVKRGSVDQALGRAEQYAIEASAAALACLETLQAAGVSTGPAIDGAMRAVQGAKSAALAVRESRE
jgi:hypothetical protein